MRAHRLIALACFFTLVTVIATVACGGHDDKGQEKIQNASPQPTATQVGPPSDWQRHSTSQIDLWLPRAFDQNLDAALAVLRREGREDSIKQLESFRGIADLVILGLDLQTLGASVVVIHIPVPDRVTTEAVVSRYKSQLPAEQGVTQSEVKVAGQYPATKLEWGLTTPRTKAAAGARTYLLRWHMDVIVITYSALLDQFGELSPIFEKSIHTLRLKD